ncbi:hypothetical protein LF95_20210 [Thalassospira sp. TSL5-1]|nr:hypothetical protein LF95_20210 [Thalassospira sp. TSL5-1]
MRHWGAYDEKKYASGQCMLPKRQPYGAWFVIAHLPVPVLLLKIHGRRVGGKRGGYKSFLAKGRGKYYQHRLRHNGAMPSFS